MMTDNFNEGVDGSGDEMAVVVGLLMILMMMTLRH